MANFDSIKAEVIARLGNRTDIAARSEIWINDAYMELAIAPRFGFYELDKEDTATTTVNGTRIYALPTDVWWLRVVEDVTNDFLLRKKSVDELDYMSLTIGRPNRYARFGASVILDPTPDGAYNMRFRYRKRPSELSTGQSSVFGREWDEVLTVMAVKIGFEALGEHTKATEQEALIQAKIATRQSTEALEEAYLEASITPRMDY